MKSTKEEYDGKVSISSFIKKGYATDESKLVNMKRVVKELKDTNESSFVLTNRKFLIRKLVDDGTYFDKGTDLLILTDEKQTEIPIIVGDERYSAFYFEEKLNVGGTIVLFAAIERIILNITEELRNEK